MRKQTVYLIRHAEATHNIKEREAVEIVKAAGGPKDEQERARKAVIQDIALTDAPLSSDGKLEAQGQSSRLAILHKVFDGHSQTKKQREMNDDFSSTRTGCTTTSTDTSGSSSSSSSSIMGSFAAPQLILVSPLRRALMTATELFLHVNDKNKDRAPPKFVALEALREKRTGFAADERSSVEDLEKQFPHVDFSDLRERAANPLVADVPIGEDNAAVRARGKVFVEGTLATSVHEDSVAIVTHKGWLREMRGTFRSWMEAGQLTVDFDIDNWDQTLYKNAEIRVNDFVWDEDTNRLSSIVSRSVENALESVVAEAVKHLLHKSLSDELIHKSLSAPSLLNRTYGMSKEQFDVDELSYTDSDSSDDEDSQEDDDDEEEEDNQDEYFFYDQESADERGQEQTAPIMVAAPLSPFIKKPSVAMDHPSPLLVTKHIYFP